MREARVIYKNENAGLLAQLDDGTFVFRYQDEWFNNPLKPAISLTFPKTQKEYVANFLFPFFYNMLPEGINKERVCFLMRIDKDDHFGLLLSSAVADTIGAVRVKKIDN